LTLVEPSVGQLVQPLQLSYLSVASPVAFEAWVALLALSAGLSVEALVPLILQLQTTS
jgi:hypothetical protein